MKKYTTPERNFIYFLFRLIRPIFDPIKFYQGITGYIWYMRDFEAYNRLVESDKKLQFNTSLFPVLDEKVNFTPFDSHYFYQQLWVFEEILSRKPEYHVDVASTYELCGYISKITKSIFVDLRPINAPLKNLHVQRGDILHLPFDDNSLHSLSCLHVIEHIGLGRYGDPIDPDGLIKACKELQRVLALDGYLYLTTPIGKKNVYFNAHRVSDSQEIVDLMSELDLVKFNVVTDDGVFLENVDYKDYATCDYACGMFLFKKSA